MSRVALFLGRNLYNSLTETISQSLLYLFTFNWILLITVSLITIITLLNSFALYFYPIIFWRLCSRADNFYVMNNRSLKYGIWIEGEEKMFIPKFSFMKRDHCYSYLTYVVKKRDCPTLTARFCGGSVSNGN